MSTLDVVVGGLYGSEAKGHAVQRLTERRVHEQGHVSVVRVAGPNAGHTGHDPSGQPWALRQVPIGAVVPGHVTLGIAAGSEIDPPVLLDELDRLSEAGLLSDKTVVVHAEATVLTDDHKVAEGDAMLTAKIGSTGKGIGAARADRIMRRAKRVIDDRELALELMKRGVIVSDENPSGSVIIEGTQGYALGLHAGYYPQCTSSDCRAIDFLAMAGVNPWNYDPDNFTIWVVSRIYPIRVAGNSGPLKGETTWDALGLPEEITTVTKKVRRVGQEDWDLVQAAIVANGPCNTRLALSMLDQKFPALRSDNMPDRLDAWAEAIPWLDELEEKLGTEIGLVMYGPNDAKWRDGFNDIP